MKQTGDPDPYRIELQPDVELWAAQLSTLARSKMSGKITALIGIYEHASITYLALDMIGSEYGDMSVTILTGQPCTNYSLHDLGTTCFDTVNLAHARRMANELLNALGISAKSFD
jgi:hypothetical protein